MQNRLISMKEVIDRVSLSKTEIYRRVTAGRFPQPVRIGERRIAFRLHEIDAWIADPLKENWLNGTAESGDE